MSKFYDKFLESKIKNSAESVVSTIRTRTNYYQNLPLSSKYIHDKQVVEAKQLTDWILSLFMKKFNECTPPIRSHRVELHLDVSPSGNAILWYGENGNVFEVYVPEFDDMSADDFAEVIDFIARTFNGISCFSSRLFNDNESNKKSLLIYLDS